MANSSAGIGFQSFGRMDGGSPTAGLTEIRIRASDTSVIYTGDVVEDSTTYGQPYVTLATTGIGASDTVRGIFAGCKYYNATVGRMIWSPIYPGSVGSSTDVTGWIYDDPQQLFVVKGSSSGIINSSYVNLNVGFEIANLGNNTNGRSYATIASSTVDNTATLPFRIVDLYSNRAPPGTIDGVDNTVIYNAAVVRPNAWARQTPTAVTT